MSRTQPLAPFGCEKIRHDVLASFSLFPAVRAFFSLQSHSSEAPADHGSPVSSSYPSFTFSDIPVLPKRFCPFDPVNPLHRPPSGFIAIGVQVVVMLLAERYCPLIACSSHSAQPLRMSEMMRLRRSLTHQTSVLPDFLKIFSVTDFVGPLFLNLHPFWLFIHRSSRSRGKALSLRLPTPLSRGKK